jgi:hypothetical protein
MAFSSIGWSLNARTSKGGPEAALTRLEEAWSDQQSSEESSVAMTEALCASPDDAAGSSVLSDCASEVLIVVAGCVSPDWSPDESPV